jgi:uncharacterized protein YegL
MGRTKKKRTYVAIILDKSGSMISNKKETIAGFNEHIQEMKKQVSEDHEIYATFVSFNSEVTTHFFNEPVDRLAEITEDSYDPSGTTAQYDAMGTTIKRLKDEVKLGENDAVLIITVSDGLENASMEYTRKDIYEFISELKKTGKWTFTMVGTSDDISNIEALGIEPGNITAYHSQAICASARSLSYYFSARDTAECSVSDYYSHTEGKDEE